jgi:hypothetical protein
MAQIVALVPVYTVTYSFLTLSHEQGAYPTVSDVKARALSMVGPSLAAAIGSGFVLVFASLLILPGIWLSVPIALIFSVVYIERAPFWSSLKRSISLVKSRWWWTLGVAFLPGTVVTIVILVAAALIFGVLGLATNLVPSFDESSSLYQILERLLQGVLKGVTYMGTVVGIVSSMAAYFHHVERLEATELAERVAALPDTPEL